jgi:hypothetical protein
MKIKKNLIVGILEDSALSPSASDFLFSVLVVK